MAYTSEIDKLERRHRENPEGRTFAPLADAYRKAGDLPRALEVLKAGLAHHPDYLSASIVLGRCHLDLGDLASAEAAFRRVLELDKENVIAIKALADITERQARFDESEHWLNYLLSIDGSNEDARQQLHRLAGVRDQHSQLHSPLEAPPEAGTEVESESGAEPATPTVPVEAVTAGGAAAGEDLAGLDIPALDEPESMETVEIPPPAPVAALDTDALDAAIEELDFAAYQPRSGAEDRPEDREDPESAERTAPAVPEFLLQEDPMAGPVSVSAEFDVGVERHEEIVLRPSATSEFQAPSDAELLDGSRGAGSYPPSFEEEDTLPGMPALSETAEGSFSEPAEPMAAPAWQTAEASFPEPAEPVAAVTAEALWQSHPEDSTGEPASEPVGTAFTESGGDAPPEAELGGPLVTETIGDVYAAQGHHGPALDVYRELLRRSPADARLAEKIASLESRQPAAAASAAQGFAAADTGGQSVLSYFGDLLSSRLPESNGAPAPAPESAPPPAGAPVSAGFMEEAFRADEESVGGEPTRPASGPLTLSAIFGEDSSPVPPVVSGPEGEQSAAGPSHFDEFFGEAGSTIRGRGSRRDSDQDDLDQFHKWLKGLKR